MAKHIFLDGHGKWDIAYLNRVRQPGFTHMPTGCTIHFYVHNSKTMMPEDVRNILKGLYTGEPESTFGPGQGAPNVKLSHLSSSDFNADCLAYGEGVDNGRLPNDTLLFNPDSAMTLQDVIHLVQTRYPSTAEFVFHWICCRQHTLRATALGGSLGMGAREYLGRGEYVLYDRSAGGKVEIGRRRIE